MGFTLDGGARVATRTPGGAFSMSERLGGDMPEHSWLSPMVGIDGAGTVVAAWLEGAPLNAVGPVKVAFRRPGEAAFEAPQASGLEATDLDRLALGVSAPGEVTLMVEASRGGKDGEWTLHVGPSAVFGNTLLARMGTPAVLAPGGFYPQFDSNARGDAVVVWDDCCPMRLQSRRRAPLSSFEPAVDAAPPIEFEGSRYGRFAVDADIDDRGNARAAWVDGEPDPQAIFAGWDGPLLTDPLPDVGPIGDLIAPVVPPEPDVPPLPDLAPTSPVLAQPLPVTFPVPPSVASIRTPSVLAGDHDPPLVTITRARMRRHTLRLRLRSSERAAVLLQVSARRYKGHVVQTQFARAGRRRLTIPLGRRARGRVRVNGMATDLAGNARRLPQLRVKRQA